MKFHTLLLLVMSLFVFNITIALIFLPKKTKQHHVFLVNNRKINLGISRLSIRKSKITRSSDIVGIVSTDNVRNVHLHSAIY